MKEKRTKFRVENKDLSSELCLTRITFAHGEDLLARVSDVSGKGVRLMIPSEDCRDLLACEDTVSVDFFHVGLSLSGRCVYLQELAGGVTAVGVEFSGSMESIILENCLLSSAGLQAV